MFDVNHDPILHASTFIRYQVIFFHTTHTSKKTFCSESALFIRFPRHNLKKYFARITRGNLDNNTTFIIKILELF